MDPSEPDRISDRCRPGFEIICVIVRRWEREQTRTSPTSTTVATAILRRKPAAKATPGIRQQASAIRRYLTHSESACAAIALPGEAIPR